MLVTNADCNLSKREADLAIRATNNPPENLIGQKILSLNWAVFASSDYLDRHGRPRSIEELEQHYIISVQVDLEFLPAFKWVSDNISQSNIVSRCNDLVSMSVLAEAGVGLAILPDDQAKPTLQRLFTFVPSGTSDIWTLIHPDMRKCKRLLAFRNYITERFKKEDVFRGG